MTLRDNFSYHGAGSPLIQVSLLLPVPGEFISNHLLSCSTIRPLTDKFAGAMAGVSNDAATLPYWDLCFSRRGYLKFCRDAEPKGQERCK